MNCSAYLASYITSEGGYLEEVASSSSNECVFCPSSDTNIFLKGFSAEYGDRWRNLGIVWAYVLFNFVVTILFFWSVRVPKRNKAN